MHGQLLARCQLTLQIKAATPVLVRGPSQKEASFLVARDPSDGRDKPCIPATTLKGVWRSASELILRSFDPTLACDPFSQEQDSPSCSVRLEKHPLAQTPAIYAAICPACRLFGSTAHAGLINIQDAWAVLPAKSVKQTRIAIDRFSQGVQMLRGGRGASFTISPLDRDSRFKTTVEFVNPELWQLGLLALVFREMSEGRVGLGSGTRKGLGHVTISVSAIEWQYARSYYASARDQRSECICSSLALARTSMGSGQMKGDWLMPGLEQQTPSGWAERPWVRYSLDTEQSAKLLSACVESALAPRLRVGLRGFFADAVESQQQEVVDA